MKKKKSAQILVYIFLNKLYTFWFKTLHSTVLILEKKFMVVFSVVTSETRTFQGGWGFKLSFYKHDIYETGLKYERGSLCLLATNVKRSSMMVTLLSN